MAIHLALALALLETLALAAVMLAWAERVAGARLLTLYLLGVAAWIVGNELPNWFGPTAMPWAMALLASAAPTSAVFLHFCSVFCGRPLGRGGLLLAYGLGGAGMLLSLLLSPGHFEPFAGIDWVPIPSRIGWITSLIWAAQACAGILVLLASLPRAAPAHRRQVAAVTLSCGWGLFCMSGYGFAALHLPYYPWQLLGLPAYPLMLVYGILRYRVFVANAWARRALVWALLLGLGLLVLPLTLMLPFASRWLDGAAVALACLTLSGPVRRIAEGLVYPGGTVSAADLQSWRRELAAAESLPALAERAAELLSRRVGLQVAVSFEQPPGAKELPYLVCRRATDTGSWSVHLQGWDSAPPGPRHAAELFGTVLAENAAKVEHASMAEQRERERQLQARLAEMGALAATVAHDLRNPLNIISMAVAGAAPETRREVAEQVARVSHLAQDLLDYAKPWQLKLSVFDAAERIRQRQRRIARLELDPALDLAWPLQADLMRFDQALDNLLSNALGADGQRRVHIALEQSGTGLLLHVCDDGPGVPMDLRERLFQPFASRSPGGTGLGLAIVARIMAAHGGSASLSERAPWTTCFTLHFPASPP